MIPLTDTIRSRHFPLMTWLLLLINAAVFAFELGLSNGALNQWVSTFALVPGRWANMPGWFALTVFTSMFMHAGWWHFLSNMWILFIFGDNVEDRMGPLSFLGFYLVSGVAAALAQVLISPFSMMPVLGASGAIAGVMGAYFLLYPRARVVTVIPILIFPWIVHVPAVLFLGLWFVGQLFSGVAAVGAVSGVAWWAHIGGFAFGLLGLRAFLRRPRPRDMIIYPTEVYYQ
jgi:membrane associated rhomboid family serine protease